MLASNMTASWMIGPFSPSDHRLVCAEQGQLVSVETVFDQRRYTDKRLDGLVNNLLVGSIVPSLW